MVSCMVDNRWCRCATHWLPYHQWVIMVNPGLIIGNYSWQKHISIFSLCWRNSAQIFFGLPCFTVSIFSTHLTQTVLQPSSLMMIIITTHFSIPIAGRSAQITCHNVVVIPNQHINLSSVSVVTAVATCPLQGVTDVLFTTLRMTEPVSKRANIYGILIIHASQTYMNLYHTGASSTTIFNHHSLPSMYVRNTRHFALLLCWTDVTDWSIDNPHRAGQCCYPVGIARNSTQCHI
jgi:hypothetical protein